MKEEWGAIKGLDMYLISNFGRIKVLPFYTNHCKGFRLVKGGFRKVYLGQNGYLAVTLKGRPYLIHRLIAESFIPNHDNKPQVNHIDGNKLNNCISNLEWVTSSENQKHAYNAGLKKCYYKHKSNSPNRKNIIAIKDTTILEFDSIKDLSIYLNCNTGSIYNKINKKKFNHKGYLICA